MDEDLSRSIRIFQRAHPEDFAKLIKWLAAVAHSGVPATDSAVVVSRALGAREAYEGVLNVFRYACPKPVLECESELFEKSD